jgi:hypothetical protein
MRIAYQFFNLSEESKEVAREKYKGTDLYQWLYNVNGTKFVISTTVNL